MTAPADSRISDERLAKKQESLTEQIRLLRARLDKTAISEDAMQYSELLAEAEFKHALITELRERRAQAVAVTDGWVMVPAVPTAEMMAAGAEANFDGSFADHPTETKDEFATIYCAMLAAAPPPAQAAGVTEEIARMALDALNGVIRLSEMGFEESLREPEDKGNFTAYNRAREARDRLETALSAQDREE